MNCIPKYMRKVYDMMRLWKGALLSTLFVFWFFVFGNDVYAAVDKSKMMEKWVFTQYYTCIREGNIVSPLAQKSSGIVADDVFKATGSLKLPSYSFQHSAGDDKELNCKELFVGHSDGLFGTKDTGVTSVIDYANGAGKTVNWSSASESQTDLEGLGYELESNPIDSTRLSIVANVHSLGYYTAGFNVEDVETTTKKYSSEITVTRDENGKIAWKVSSTTLGDNLDCSRINLKIKRNKLYKDVSSGFSFSGLVQSLFTKITCSDVEGYDNKEIVVDLSDDMDATFDSIKRALSNVTWAVHMQGGEASMTVNTYNYFTFDHENLIDSGKKGDYIYAKDKNSFTVSSEAIRKMSGMSIEQLMFTNNELYTLYYYYLEQNVPAEARNKITCSPDSTSGLELVRLKDSDGEFKQCYVNL